MGLTVPPARVAEAARNFGLDFAADELILLGELIGRELDDYASLARADLAGPVTSLRDPGDGVPPWLEPQVGPAGRAPIASGADLTSPSRGWLARCRIDPPDGSGRAGVLSGRTVAFKDHIAVAGLPTTFGAASLRGGPPASADASVVTRVLAAGARVLGKTMLSGLVRPSYAAAEPPRNTRFPGLVTGGSSSGSAAAVGAGEVDIAFGGDQGGSVRIPAAFGRLVGFKPTFGLIPHTGAMFTSDPRLDHLGPIARTVVDVAAAVEAVRGPDGLDPRQAGRRRDGSSMVDGLDVGVRGRRVGVLTEAGAPPCEPSAAAAVLAAARWLRGNGMTVIEIGVGDHRHATTVARALTTAGTWRRAQWARTVIDHPGATDGATAAFAGLWIDRPYELAARLQLSLLLIACGGLGFAERLHAAATAAGKVVRSSYDRTFAHVDVLVMPTAIQPPAEIGNADQVASDLATELAGVGDGFGSVARNTQPFCLTGHPALSVPVADAGAGPVGVQIVGPRHADRRVLQVGYSVAGPA